jgi:sodium transport system ATP-binding protein
VIAAEGLRKSFGARVALRGVTFIARDGAITGLLGPNGAGKSTTLRILSTVLAPDAGRVSVDGMDGALERLRVRAALGVLPSGAGLYRELSARENVRYYAALQGREGPAVEARIEALFAELGLEAAAEVRGKALSQGQRAKVALARALVHEPQNLILDEPTNGLDILAVRSLHALLNRLRDAGRCVLFSSHLLGEVATLCDEIVVLSEGSSVAHGSTAALAEGHASLEAAYLSALGEAP